MQSRRNDAPAAGASAPDAPAGIEIHPVTLDRWDDTVTLFNTSLVTRSCWCKSPRMRASEFSRFGSESRRRNQEAMHRLVATGTIPGLLAYVDGRPVG